ncbi:hypothetical protein J1N35_038340 [Gossypium stocksii]|uniref:Uncharacterized protein n=1 Tax=Gossypium stocksii TaxID=47602 RepID=A0A9D3ULT5_9ROSI|nr:hypothetical protein J1N35_038340 [Gossypium stocksii]
MPSGRSANERRQAIYETYEEYHQRYIIYQGARGDIDAQLDGMIRWMKEIWPALQEFGRMNGLRALNYQLDMFRNPTKRRHKQFEFYTIKGGSTHY